MVDWVSCHHLLMSVDFCWNCFFSAWLSLILIKLVMNDTRERGYKVTERILNICINYSILDVVFASCHHLVNESWVKVWTWCLRAGPTYVMRQISSFTTWVTCRQVRRTTASVSVSSCTTRCRSSLTCRRRPSQSRVVDKALVLFCLWSWLAAVCDNFITTAKFVCHKDRMDRQRVGVHQNKGRTSSARLSRPCPVPLCRVLLVEVCIWIPNWL